MRRVFRPILPPVPVRASPYVTTVTTTTNETDSTWTGVDIGEPHPHRLVVLACYHGVGASSEATIGGVKCAKAQAGSHEFSLHFLRVPDVTTADITVSATSSLRKAVNVYVIYPCNPLPVDFGVASQGGTTDATVSNIQVQQGGVLIYSGGQHATLGTFTTTWNGSNGTLVENVDAQLESAASYTSGHILITGPSSSEDDLTLAESASGTKRIVAAAWGPPVRTV